MPKDPSISGLNAVSECVEKIEKIYRTRGKKKWDILLELIQRAESLENLPRWNKGSKLTKSKPG